MSDAWAWASVVALGLFHGVNPGMGWLLAVSAALQSRSTSAVLGALPPLAAGHGLAMLIVLVPVALLDGWLAQPDTLRIFAALVLIGFGLYKLWWPRPPRALSHIGPRRLVLWSGVMATAHGAGLMLMPIFLGMSPAGHAHDHASHASIGVALAAVAVHTLAMIGATGIVAWVVYRYLGLRLLQRTWFNADLLWALALVAVGLLGLLTAW